MRRWVSEHHTVKLLVEPQGVVLGLTMRRYSILFLLTKRFAGFRRIRTTDRVVARAGYSAPATLALIRSLYPTGYRGDDPATGERRGLP
jgi:hypothetical protein